MGGGLNFPIAFFGNLTYRLFVTRLQRSRGFEMPRRGCDAAARSAALVARAGSGAAYQPAHGEAHSCQYRDHKRAALVPTPELNCPVRMGR